MQRFSSIGKILTVDAAVSDRVATISFSGELDRDATLALADLACFLSGFAPQQVVFEVRDLTFAGAVLPALVVDLRQRLPGEPAVEIREPRPLIRWVLTTVGMGDLVSAGT